MYKIIEWFNNYFMKRTWRVKESSSAPYSFGAMQKYVIGEASKVYWLNTVYSQPIVDAYNNNWFHIHDLGGLTLYCSGYSLRNILLKGVRGIPNVSVSAPAKHFGSVLNQLSNLMTIFQNEIMGAVAYSSFDTLLAPFVHSDGLTYQQVKQDVQNYIYSVNSNSRAGAEPAFSNLTFDLFCPEDLKNQPAIIGGKPYGDYLYKDFQKEMDMINRAFCEVMRDGDAVGQPFAYPIPTYNIMKGFDWDNPNNDVLWEMTGKYGYPYFANYINSDMDPSDVRSMCCRLRLDLTDLKRRTGGLFASGDSTGSIGVVTMNLPKIALESYFHAYRKPTMSKFYNLLKYFMGIAKDSLEEKRKWLNDNVIGTGLLPAFDEYVGSLHTYFSTIGFVGLNECIVNLTSGKENIRTDIGSKMASDILIFMRKCLVEYQKKTGHMYNLEATPAESTCYRLAKNDVSKYGLNAFTQGDKGEPYYTNSCHIPVKDVDNLDTMFRHQEKLQPLLTGGTVVHAFMGSSMSGESAKQMIKTACENYKIPYVDICPLIKTCPEHGWFEGQTCPVCGHEPRLHQKVTGYIRPVDQFNIGKYREFMDRKQL